MRAAVVTMRSVFPVAAALARAWNLRNVETWVVKTTENPLTSLITAPRRAHAFQGLQGKKF